ncbi:hypothetical protein Ddc_03583 [Ditylenchus destructor]|nr:hypothetical protein Ddc_03583 [Ditylenchus destructor]
MYITFLYAASFMIYSMNCVCQWLHIYCIMNGYLTSFPLKNWFAVGLVAVAVSGSMLCALLVMLCVENAFAHRLNITPYKSGLAVIWEAFVEWIHSFNNFRVAFLFMALHDLPIVLTNFFLIPACRCAGPKVLHWPLLVSSLSTSVSLIWRLVMLYFAYRRLVFSPAARKESTLPLRQWSFRNHIGASISISDGGRLNEFDETWPIRWSIATVYGDYPNKQKTVTFYVRDKSETNSPRSFCTFLCSLIFVKTTHSLCALIKRLLCIVIALISYLGCLMVGCMPCIYFYTCRRNSFAHRHRCSKAFIRYCTFIFHYGMLTLSLLCAFSLLILNFLLIASVHVIGSNDFPPEISRICVSVDKERRTIRPLLLPSRESIPWGLVSVTLGSPDDEYMGRLYCKPIWEDGELGIGLNRQMAGPWQTRVNISIHETLAISTHFVSDYTDTQTNNFRGRHVPTHTFLYDFAIIRHPPLNTTSSTNILSNVNPRRTTTPPIQRNICVRRKQVEWTFIKSLKKLGFPYFLACSSTIRIQRKEMIDCRIRIDKISW